MTQPSARHIMADGQRINLDPEGYLTSLSAWTPAVAEMLAAEEGRELTPMHWGVIEVLRDFYTRFEMAPAMRALIKALRQSPAAEAGSSIRLMQLFPAREGQTESPAKVAARLAGLPKPTNCL